MTITHSTTSALGSTTLRAEVVSVTRAADRVMALQLQGAQGIDLPRWEPGSHIDVALTDGLLRQYSLCSAPGDPVWRLGVLEETDGRGGSRHVHHQLRVGDVLRVSPPRNKFALRLGTRPLVFVAGGIGITPILSMVHAAATAGADWQVLVLARTPEAAAFVDELSAYGERVHTHFASTSGRADLPTVLDGLGAAHADVYACGPLGLMTALEDYTSARPDCDLRLERFTTDGNPAIRPGDHAFVVEISDGTEIEVRADQTILDALTEADVPVLNSCREGVCGTCETFVLEGTPDHRDQLLDADERASGEMMMPCVSRCVGPRIVLDL